MEPVHALEASSDDVAVADSSGPSPDRRGPSGLETTKAG